MNNSTQNFIPPYTQNMQQVTPQNYAPAKTKNKFFTFIFSLIPGAGQMYQGLMKRGLSIMLLFTFIIAAAVFTNLPAIIIVLPTLWFYSFFDTMNRINYTKDELAALNDDYLFVKIQSDGSKNTLQRIFSGRHMLLGWIFIVFSLWLILKIVFSYYFVYSYIPNEIKSFANFLIDVIPSMIIPVLCIFIGIKLIKGNNQKQPLSESNQSGDENSGD